MAQKVVLISGGSSGIGLACARSFASAGYRVYEISRSGHDQEGIRHLTADVTDMRSLRQAFAQLASEVDGLDVLICSAGYGIAGSVECTAEEAMERQFDVNVYGTVRLVQLALPLLREREGRCFFISSVAAVLSLPFQAFYSATKSCLNQLALALNNELRPAGLSFTAIMPGDLATGFTGVRDYPRLQREQDLYGVIPARAIEKMARDEEAGDSPEKMARYILKLAERKRRPRPLLGFGLKYRAALLLAKLLPAGLSHYILGKMYCK